VSEDIRSLTARLAEEPSSLAFLELGEALRRRGRLEAGYKVARGGLSRYPGLADAHDLVARILSDQGDLAGAFDAWTDALRLDPMRTSALKGIAFLYFRAGDVTAALTHLERACEADPDDPSIPPAIAKVMGAGPRAEEPAAAAPTTGAVETEETAAVAVAGSPFEGLEGGDRGLVLVDGNGLRLAGDLANGGGDADRVAAQLAGLSREAARATRLLGLGGWHSIAVESADGHLFVSAPTADTVLLALRDHSLPMARVGLLAERAARAARIWLEQTR